MKSNSRLFFILSFIYSLFLANYLHLIPYCLAFPPSIYFTYQNPTNNGEPSYPPQPDQTPAADPSQQWCSDDQPYSQQPYEAPPAVQPYTPPSWDEQDSVSAQSGWGGETAASAQSGWGGETAAPAQSGWGGETAASAQSGWAVSCVSDV